MGWISGVLGGGDHEEPGRVADRPVPGRVVDRQAPEPGADHPTPGPGDADRKTQGRGDR